MRRPIIAWTVSGQVVHPILHNSHIAAPANRGATREASYLPWLHPNAGGSGSGRVLANKLNDIAIFEVDALLQPLRGRSA